MDFTSALYLGLKHDTGSLGSWKSLTSGKPAALEEAKAAGLVAHGIARLQGLESGLLYPSTLHLFWDLFSYWSDQRIAIYVDRELYPIASWGVERAAGKGIPVYSFSHLQVGEFSRTLRQNRRDRRLPILVTDGWCPQCGKAAPLPEYLEILRPYQGWLVIDDTQALGVLGQQPTWLMPYGRGGGGVLPYLGIRNKKILVGSSLAKGFGVPMAILSGPRDIIERIRRQSLTRIHCSPPSAAVISGAKHAMAVNRKEGEQRREILMERVMQFKEGLQSAGVRQLQHYFPVQHLHLSGKQTSTLYERLQRQNIQTVLTRGHKDQGQVTFLLRADHREEDIDEAVSAVVKHMNRVSVTRYYGLP